MTCSACSSSVEKVLGGRTGVSKATVNHITGLADVSFDPNEIGDDYSSGAKLTPFISIHISCQHRLLLSCERDGDRNP